MPLPRQLQLKLVLGVAAPLVHVLLYTAANQYPLFKATVLPLSRLDLAVPLIPETVWIYLSNYALVLFAFVLCRDTRRFAVAGFSVIVASVLVQWLWPVAYPRELYPIDPAGGLSAAALVMLRSIDAPVSCLPSLHVGLAFVSALALGRSPPVSHPGAVTRLFFVWVGAVALSTLTVKQHYVLDVFGGLLLAAAVHALTAPGAFERAAALMRRNRIFRANPRQARWAKR